MSTYLLNFIVYTAAMVGIIFLAVFVYKKFSCSTSSRSKFLNVEECISLAPRKELYVVRAGNERFLVISKLDDNSSVPLKKENTCSVDELPTIVDFPRTSHNSQKKVFKNIINNI